MGEEMNTLWGGIFVFWMLGSWMTHVIACIQAGEWLFLIAGALFFPIAIIHGTGVWFGVW
jgi:hypothetical protein